ncbi:MAG: hypothetical protein RXQ02_09630 [Thermoproteus sp.]
MRPAAQTSTRGFAGRVEGADGYKAAEAAALGFRTASSLLSAVRGRRGAFLTSRLGGA